MKGRIYMNDDEIYRIEIIKKVQGKEIKVSKAAKLLDLSPRQVGRLRKAFKENGSKGLVSKKLGSKGNNQVAKKQKELVLVFFKNEDHRDFSPTLAHEYMVKNNTLSISVSSVRNIMIKANLWGAKQVRKQEVHPLRERRAQLGELIQLDGSEHDWFEGRGPRCTLLVYIDDATSKVLHLKFVKSENTLDYLQATREYIEKNGRPETFYPDKHSVFRINREGALNGHGKTQFARALEELGIRLICANSPQAKGRVERRNRDFQNRLVKAMRIAKICTIEAANVFLPQFLIEFNLKFAKAPRSPINAHKPILSTHNLDKIFCLKDTRCLSKNLILQYENILYQICADKQEHTLRKAKVTVLKTKEGKISFEYRGKSLKAIPYNEVEAKTEEVSSKELLESMAKKLSKKVKYIPPHNHAWKRWKAPYS